jgi:Chemoreceptor zinc-binding domain
MDFDAAIRKHAEWKFRFRDAAREQTALDAPLISRDNQCDLGKWLHGEGQSMYFNNPAFTKLVKAHAAFHAEAGKVASLVNRKRSQELDRALANGSPYAEASKTVSVCVIELKNSAR